MKKQIETPTVPDTNARRNFLLGATVGTVGAVAAVVTATVKDTAPVATAAAAPTKTKGYHMTAHIQHYYDTTRTM